MTEQDPRALLLRYLRQRLELGVREWVFERVDAATLLEVLRSGFAPAPDPFDALRAEALVCTRCGLCETRTQVVFGEGDRRARLMVVGEAPGSEEDRTGRPFVGAAGKLLDTLLLSVGFRREEVYICNVLKCRPPGNRDPRPEETRTCAPYLRRQIELIGPRAIVALGRFAAQTLLEAEASLSRLRGIEHRYEGVPVIVTYHPAALLRNPLWTRAAWEDLQRVRRMYDDVGGRPPRGAAEEAALG